MIIIPKMMHLPKNCHECPFSFWDEEGYECRCSWHNCTVDYYDGNKMRMDDCPMIESEETDDYYKGAQEEY